MEIIKETVDHKYDFAHYKSVFRISFPIWKLEETPNEIKVVPKAIYKSPFVAAILGPGILIIVFSVFKGFIWQYLIVLFVVIAGSLICYYSLKKENSKGSYFIYDKKKNEITLPRYGISFPFNRLIAFQEIEANFNGELLADFEILVRNDKGDVDRYLIIGSLIIRLFNKISRNLAEKLNCRLISIKNDSFGRNRSIRTIYDYTVD